MSSTSLAAALVVPFEQLRMTDVESVGGKNASLGEMISQLAASGVRVPGGFATTSTAYRQFLQHNALTAKIEQRLAGLNIDDVRALAAAGAEIRRWVVEAPLPADLEAAVRAEFARLAAGQPGASFAVRSSATAEDLPDASFAGQQETFLNVVGIDDVLAKMKEVFASLYNDRAIAYRVHKGFAHGDVALSAGVQRMVRSDLGAAGVMFTIDTESGFPDVVFITASYGLGETVVQGAVNPDEFYVHKPTLKAGKHPIIRRSLGSKLLRMVFTNPEEKADGGRLVKTVDTPPEQRNRYALSDADVVELARYALVIEQHYGRAMDIEWGKDGVDGKIYILQARPETVKSQARVEHRYKLKGGGQRHVLSEGRAIGQKIGTGPVRVVHNLAEMDKVQPGDVLVADMTDPNWEPVMKRAAAIVTNRGGRTCHAAIIARELGIPAVVGCGHATDALHDGALGPALLLAALAAADAGDEFPQAARDALAAIADRWRAAGDDGSVPIGATTGLGSVAYGLCLGGVLLGEERLLEDAVEVARAFTPDRVASDPHLDVVAGAAGGALALLAVARARPEPWVIAGAVRCGDRLLAAEDATAPGTWRAPAGYAYTGFAHGVAGIAAALARLAEVTGAARFHDPAARAHGRLAGVGGGAPAPAAPVPPEQARRRPDPLAMTAWCHGAPGITLALLGAPEALRGAGWRADVHAAVQACATVATHKTEHVCCGNLSRAEALFAAARQLGSSEADAGAGRTAAGVVRRALALGHVRLSAVPYDYRVFDHAFFQGTSGAGYQLLRMAGGGRLPSVLALEGRGWAR